MKLEACHYFQMAYFVTLLTRFKLFQISKLCLLPWITYIVLEATGTLPLLHIMKHVKNT
jgi:hypothetical protein